MKSFSVMFPFSACLLSLFSAQLAKPIYYYLFHKEWHWRLIGASGSFPSSHSAAVAALSLAVGIQEQFSSAIFAVTLAFSAIIIYDAANVRYYAGQNIQITQQLIKDLQESNNIKLSNPIYQRRIKDVLGHKWVEVIGGIIHGFCIAMLIYYMGGC